MTLTSKQQLDYSSLFLVGNPFNKRDFCAGIESKGVDALRLFRGECHVHSPLSAVWIAGRASPSDLVWTDSAAKLLVSARCREVLKRFSGWKSVPVDLRGKDREEIPGYEVLTVAGRAGPIDPMRTRTRKQKYPGGDLEVCEGMYFEHDHWDGTDFFMLVEPTSFLFVTLRVKQELLKSGIRNLTFDDLSRLQLDRAAMDVLVRHRKNLDSSL